MSLLSQKKNIKSTLQDKLTQKIKILKELQKQELETASYTETQFILNNKKIKQTAIKMFLTQIYAELFDDVNIQWHTSLSTDKILNDLFAIKKKAVEQHWLTENLQKNKMEENQLKVKLYTEKVQTKQAARQRVKAIKNEMKILEAQIDMSKSEEQSFELQKKYESIKVEFAFLANKRRRMRIFTEEKQSQVNNQIDQNKIEDLQRKIEAVSLERQQDRYLKSISKKPKQQKYFQKPEKGKQTSKNRLKKLEDIFYMYSKQQCKNTMLFGQMQANNTVSIQNFLRMIALTKIESTLTKQEKVSIFKECSKYSRKIDFINFTQALKQICQKNCEKLNLPFEAKILDIFLDEFINRVEQHSRGSQQKNADALDAENILKNKEQSKYKYSLKAHSGKLEQNLQDELTKRKKVKELKQLQRKKQNLSVECTPSQMSNHMRSIQTRTPYLSKRSKVNVEEPKKLITLPSETSKSKVTQMSNFDQGGNYASIFQKRRQHELQKQKRYYPYNLNDARNVSNKLSVQQTGKQFKELNIQPTIYNSVEVENEEQSRLKIRQLVEYEDEDPFLTSHLQKNKIFSSKNSSRAAFKIHF